MILGNMDQDTRRNMLTMNMTNTVNIFHSMISNRLKTELNKTNDLTREEKTKQEEKQLRG